MLVVHGAKKNPSIKARLVVVHKQKKYYNERDNHWRVADTCTSAKGGRILAKMGGFNKVRGDVAENSYAILLHQVPPPVWATVVDP